MDLLNLSLLNSSLSPIAETPSLDQLLDSLGFYPLLTIAASFVLPTISFLGIIFCSLSAWIFFDKKFKDPVFFYYRLLCIVYIIHLVHNIPYGIVFSPRYFPNIDTYVSCIYIIYYANVSALLFHFEDTLQMAILLTRMKIYNSFVKKHFSSKPWLVSLALFLTCLFIDSFNASSLKIASFGTYYSYDSFKGSKEIETFYYFTSSDFSSTLLGKIVLGLTFTFLNVILSAIVGVILNIVSICLYKSYVRERRNKEESYTSTSYNHSHEEIQVVVASTSTRARKLTQKEINENKAERNMFYLALTLCSISVLSRVLSIIVFIFFIFFNSFFLILILLMLQVYVYLFSPVVSILIFYYFNKMFREKFKEKFLSKIKNTATVQTPPRD